MKFYMSGRTILTTNAGLHRFNVILFDQGSFDPTLPFCFDLFSVRRIGIGKAPPTSLVGDIFNRVAKELGELVIDQLVLVLWSTSDYLGDRRAKHNLSAVFLASLERSFCATILGDVRHHRERPVKLSIVSEDRNGYHSYPQLRTVFSPEPLFPLFVRSLLAVLQEHHLVVNVFRKVVIQYTATNHIAWFISQHLRHLAVHIGITKVRVEEPDPFICRLKNPAIPILTLS